MTTAAELVAAAAKWDGYAESPAGSNSTLFNRWRYGSDTRVAWCGNFLNYVLWHELGIALGGGPKGSGYTPAIAEDGKARGLWRPWDAPVEPGWAVLYYHADLGRIAHTGLTATRARAGEPFKAWEGTTDRRGGRTGGRVILQTRARSSVGRPGGFVNLNRYLGSSSSPDPSEDDLMQYARDYELAPGEQRRISWPELGWLKTTAGSLALGGGPSTTEAGVVIGSADGERVNRSGLAVGKGGRSVILELKAGDTYAFVTNAGREPLLVYVETR